jgi:mycothiol synthase
MKQAFPEKYTSRPATLQDAGLVSNLWNERSKWARATTPYRAIDVEKRWQHPRFNLATDSLLIFDPASTLVGYAHLRDVKDPPVDVFSGYSVHPDHDTELWLWSALFGWIESEARRVIEVAPPQARIVLLAGATDDDPSECARLEAQGFDHSRTFYSMKIDLDRPLDSAQSVGGIVLRAFVPGQDDEAQVGAYRDAFRDHYGHLKGPFSDDLAQLHRAMQEDDFDPALWFLATGTAEGGAVAGYCLCYPENRGDVTMGLIDEVGVRRAWRRRGIARMLLLHALDVLKKQGLASATLCVDSINKKGALGLYESVGMAVASSSHTYVKELRPGENLVTQ